VRVLATTVAAAVEMTAIVTTQFGRDCALATGRIAITAGQQTSGTCGSISSSGLFCFDQAGQCFTNVGCSTKRVTTQIFRVFPMTYSVGYRRVKSTGKLRNSYESKCGPRFEFTVDGIPQFLSTEAAFLSQGVLSFSGNTTLRADGSLNDVKFNLRPVGCKKSKLLVFDEQALVDVKNGPLDVFQSAAKENRFAEVDFKK
jgi:hypothetical protein